MMLRRPTTSVLGSLLLFLLLLSPAAFVSAEQDFMDLVRDVPADKLHAALHEYTGEKFKHGVFPADRTALEAVHRERAADASRIVQLARRQTANDTTFVTSTTQAESSTSQVTAETTTTTSSSSDSSTSDSPTPTPTPSQTTTASQTEQTTTSESPSTTSTSTTTSETPSPTSTSTEESTTSSDTPTPTTTSTTRRLTSFTSTYTRTLTGSDGSPSTVTEITVVPAQTDDSTASSTAARTSVGTPSLQTNAANVMGARLANYAAVGAALAGLFAL